MKRRAILRAPISQAPHKLRLRVSSLNQPHHLQFALRAKEPSNGANSVSMILIWRNFITYVAIFVEQLNFIYKKSGGRGAWRALP